MKLKVHSSPQLPSVFNLTNLAYTVVKTLFSIATL